jgi:hypothetical protein
MFHVCASLYLKKGGKDENLPRTAGKGTKLEFAGTKLEFAFSLVFENQILKIRLQANTERSTWNIRRKWSRLSFTQD